MDKADALDVGMNERDRSTRQERRLDLQSGSSASRGSVMGPSGEITNMHIDSERFIFAHCMEAHNTSWCVWANKDMGGCESNF